MSTRPLGGRVALVTGANHGIGEAVAAELARLGADVLATYLRSRPPGAGAGDPSPYERQRRSDGRRVTDLVARQGARGHAVEADLADQDTPRALFDTAEERFGAVSILVNNASGWCQDTLSGRDADRFGRPMGPVTARSSGAVFDVDARAGALLIAELARRHRQRGDTWGRIVSMSSGTPAGFPEEVSYGAAKAALENYTMSAATELADLGVTANVVYPPITDTGWVTDEVRRSATAAGTHIATPGDVAEVVGWLCTDAARLVSGNRIRMR
jgi:3-oxoacyl-[acyl-carrier protein] reductase